jgi:Biopolymer transport protein
MADIAFLLLVFFLVTTTIDMDKGLGIILPAEGQELEINKKNILNCLISASGAVLLGGEPVEMRHLSRHVQKQIHSHDTSTRNSWVPFVQTPGGTFYC